MNPKPFSILFVCTGNICRSPTAEAVFRHKVQALQLDSQFLIDSAGTHAYHVGEPPDPRTIETACRRGIKMDDLRARKIALDDYERFDLILAMDAGHYAILNEMAPPNTKSKLAYFLEGGADVPDPYYGQGDGFEKVFDMVDLACERILADWQMKKGNV
jgi:protein-tyrosine phosphatase